MNAQRQRFVNAYLGEAKGNGAKAAIIAGYSEKAARQIASRLLTYADVREAIGRRLEREDIRTDAILKRLGKIAHSEPEKVTAGDVVAASKVILQVNGALKEKSSDSRITVNIGFLGSHKPSVQVIEEPATIDGEAIQVMPSRPHAALVSGEE